MGYEFAVLAPAYICLIARRGWSASATIVFIILPILVWAFGEAILPFMPRLIALVMLVAATVADTELRPKDRENPALA